MSYILDALRKADQDRHIGDVPDLATPHWIQRRGGRVRPWAWVVLALLLVNGVLVAMLFIQDDDTDRRSGVTSNVPGPAQDRFRELAVKSPRDPQRAAITKDSSSLSSLPRVPDERVKSPRPARPAAVAVSPPVVKPSAVQRVRAGEAEIPEWNEMPLEFRRDFDPPRLDVHVYDDEPSRRFILIRLQRYKEGDTLNSGAKLEKIMPGSIQLNYRGTRFRIDR